MTWAGTASTDAPKLAGWPGTATLKVDGSGTPAPTPTPAPGPLGFALNGSTNAKLRAMLARVKAGTGSGIIGVNGDSTGAGAGGGGNGTIAQQLANARQYRASAVLAQLLTSAGYPTVDSMVVGDNGCAIFGVALSSYDPRVVAGTNWPGAGGQTYAGGGYLAGSGNGLWEFTPIEPVSAFEVVAYNTGGAFGFAIDGSTSIAITAPGATIINNNVALPNTGSGFTKITIQAGALGSHKFGTIVTDQGNGGTPQLRSVRGISPTPRIEIFNRASSGAQSFEQAATGSNWLNADVLSFDAADGQIINVGLNDAGQGTSIATTRTSIQRLIDRAKPTGDPLLVVPNAANPSGFATQAAQDAVRAAILDLAATNNVAVCDLRAKFGEWGVVAPRTADNLVHPGRAFYADIGAYINDCIMAMAA